MTEAITSFDGTHRFLSNFFSAPVVLDGVTYPTVEHAFQAAKTKDPLERRRIQAESKPGKAKALGRQVTKVANWDEIRISVMHDLVRQKFTRHRNYGVLLLRTGDAELIEGNTWDDRFWGAVWEDGHWNGENHLGRILMSVRAELQGRALIELAGEAAKEPIPFQPGAWHNKDGDMLEIYFENVDHIAKWVNPQLTLLLARDDGRIIGCYVEGLQKVLEQTDYEMRGR